MLHIVRTAIAFFTLFAFQPLYAQSSTLDLKPYFPRGNVTYDFYLANGKRYSTYAYIHNDSNFDKLFDTYFSDVPYKGKLAVWQKAYNESRDISTYALMMLGNSGGVWEIGDWHNDNKKPADPDIFSTIMYYSTAETGKKSALNWSPSGGLTLQEKKSGAPYTYKSKTNTTYVSRKLISDPSEFGSLPLAYDLMVAEKIPQFKPKFGRNRLGKWVVNGGKTYRNVVRLLFYHGTNTGNPAVDCSSKKGNELKSYYNKVPGFGSYVSEYYLAPGKWIIQERTLYVEDATYWRDAEGKGPDDCFGAAFDLVDSETNYISYIDDK